MTVDPNIWIWSLLGLALFCFNLYTSILGNAIVNNLSVNTCMSLLLDIYDWLAIYPRMLTFTFSSGLRWSCDKSGKLSANSSDFPLTGLTAPPLPQYLYIPVYSVDLESLDLFYKRSYMYIGFNILYTAPLVIGHEMKGETYFWYPDISFHYTVLLIT